MCERESIGTLSCGWAYWSCLHSHWSFSVIRFKHFECFFSSISHEKVLAPLTVSFSVFGNQTHTLIELFIFCPSLHLVVWCYRRTVRVCMCVQVCNFHVTTLTTFFFSWSLFCPRWINTRSLTLVQEQTIQSLAPWLWEWRSVCYPSWLRHLHTSVSPSFPRLLTWPTQMILMKRVPVALQEKKPQCWSEQSWIFSRLNGLHTAHTGAPASKEQHVESPEQTPL